MPNSNRFSSGVVWSYLQSWAARGITTFSFLVVGWYLGPAEFGAYAVVAATLLFAELICEQSFSQVVVQLNSMEHETLSTIFAFASVCGVLFAFGIFLASGYIADLFNAPSIVGLLQTAAFCPVLIGLTAVPVGLLRRELDFKALARRTVLSSGVSSAAGIAMVVAGQGAWGLVLQAVLYYAIGASVLWRNCMWRPRMNMRLADTLPLAKLAFWNATNKLTDFAETRGLEMLVGLLGGVQALGIFAFASKLAQTAFQTFGSPLLEVVFAQVARQRGKADIEDAVLNGQLIMATLPSGLMFGLACIATPLLALLYGDRWSNAALVLTALSLAYLVRGLFYVIGSALLATGEARITVRITALRAGLTLLFCVLYLSWTESLSDVAWGFLISGLLVAPISSFVLSKKIGVSVKTLISVPLKVAVAMAAGFSVVALGQLTAPGGAASIAWATLASGVFLLVVIFLNAGHIAHSLKGQAQTGRASRLLGQVQKLAAWTLELRERLRVLWFEMSLRAAASVFAKSSAKLQVLVIPGDTAGLDGSLGDQALLIGFRELTEKDPVLVVVSETFQVSHLFKDMPVLRAWHGLAAGWRLGRQVAKTKAIYVIGADVMDGFYSPAVSCQRLVALRVFQQHGVPASVLGFSFNPTPHPRVVREFQRLPDNVRICLRDAVSLERFKRIVARPAHLVADLAFVVKSVVDSEVYRDLKPWIERERNQTRRLLGINVNPHVVAHLAADAESAIALSVAQACEKLVAAGTSLVLIPHDFRPGCADLRVMKLVWHHLSETARAHALLLEKSFTAQEIKAVCVEFDLVFSARMHLAIGALSVGTPVCGMQYQGKFAGLFQHFRFGDDVFISPEDAVDSERLATFLLKQLGQSQVMKQQVNQQLAAVRELTYQNIVQTAG